MDNKIAEVKGLMVRIGKNTILDNINISFNKGDSVLIAGKNGAGKSTFLKCLADVIIPDKGSITYHDNINKSRIGFISDRVSLLENFTLKEGIRFHTGVFGIKKFDYSPIERMGWDPGKKIKHLSAGERVLFHLALLVEQQPAVLLLDEIIHTIDPYLRANFLETVIDLLDRLNTTVIMVNHTFSELEKIPERILVMEKGRFILDEKSEALRGRIKKIVSDQELPSGLPVIFKRERTTANEFYIYPFKEEFRSSLSQDFLDLDLTEILQAIIGGQYVS